MKRALCLLAVALAVLSASCEKKPAKIAGMVIAPSGLTPEGVTVSLEFDGAEVACKEVNPQSGSFSFVLDQVGTYSIKVKRGDKSMEVDDVEVERGESYEHDPILLPDDFYAEAGSQNSTNGQDNASAPPAEMGVLKGKCVPSVATISLKKDGAVVAQGQCKVGSFEVEAPVGTYDVEFGAQGFYTMVEKGVSISTSGQSRNLDVFLLYYTTLETIDWANGVVRGSGTGDTNPNVPKAEGAKSACNKAYGHAIQDLTESLLLVHTGPGKSVGDVGDSMRFKVGGMLQKIPPKSKSIDAAGVCTVTMEYPLFGANGVVGFVKKNGGI